MTGRRGAAAVVALLAVLAAGCSGAGSGATAGTGAPASPSLTPPLSPPLSSPALSSSGPAASVPATASPDAAGPAVATAPRTSPAAAAVNHCASNPDAQRVIVSVALQHAWMCARHTAVYSTGVTTGMLGRWTETPTGTFEIQGRTRNTTLTLNTGATYAVKYWIPFQGPLFGFHDASWQRFPYGSAQYRTDGSHGCVHMPLAAMAFLYRWSARPTSVRIR